MFVVQYVNLDEPTQDGKKQRLHVRINGVEEYLDLTLTGKAIEIPEEIENFLRRLEKKNVICYCGQGS